MVNEHDIHSLRARPRFRKYIGSDMNDVLTHFNERLLASGSMYSGSVAGSHVFISFPAEKRHLWTPQLSLEVEPIENKTLLRGLFGPRPAIWTLFVFLYTVIGLLTLGALILGLTQLSLGESAWPLWLVPLGIALETIIFFIGQMGQKLGKEQMIILYEFMETSLDSFKILPDPDME